MTEECLPQNSYPAGLLTPQDLTTVDHKLLWNVRSCRSSPDFIYSSSKRAVRVPKVTTKQGLVQEPRTILESAIKMRVMTLWRTWMDPLMDQLTGS